MSKVFLTGISCVGKTTIGRHLATLLNVTFFDLDAQVERFYGKPISRIQSECLTMYSYRKRMAVVLTDLLKQNEGRKCVVALPPSALMHALGRVLKRGYGPVVVLSDTPENILARITFYDADSRQIHKQLTDKEKRFCLKEIKKDITYFGKSYCRADLTVDINGMGPVESAEMIMKMILLLSTRKTASQQKVVQAPQRANPHTAA